MPIHDKISIPTEVCIAYTIKTQVFLYIAHGPTKRKSFNLHSQDQNFHVPIQFSK